MATSPIIPVRVTKQQRRTIKRAADAVGLPVSTYMRVCSMDYANAKIKPFALNKEEITS